MMIQIKTLNAISPVYGEILPEDRYAVSADIAAPDAILVRSADMHEYAPEKNLLCVARAGAGYNNIPTDAFAEQGKFKQAEATFKSIADGYKDDEWISGELNIRLDRLKQINR